MRILPAFALSVVLTAPTLLHAQKLNDADRTKIESAMTKVMDDTGTPSISLGIARGGNVIYTKAFGHAVLEEQGATTQRAVLADAAMAYPIGSISKQFTAACILLLQERGKLKLDDPVGKWFPDFTEANKVTVRNLLTHTSGYSDYAPQDYTIPAWTKPIKSETLIREWATKPLDFEPGTKWQYSNTNFQMAALIIEKVTGQKFHDFLWANVITPLKLQGVLDLDTDRAKLQVRGYERHAMGPLRPAILESPGWYTGDGGLAMPIATLMQWDESIVHRTLLKPASYDEMIKPFILKDGSDSHYGLGVFSQVRNGKHFVSHSGEVGGFVSNNVIALDDDIAFAALTNVEGPGAAPATSALVPILLPSLVNASKKTASKPEEASAPAEPTYDKTHAEQVKTILLGLQKGSLDRNLLTADANFYFNETTIGDFKSSLQPLGALQTVTQTSEKLRGGMIFRTYDAEFAGKTLDVTTYTQNDGKLEQFLVEP
ncbi:serine hydrolase domain-containing protein [Terriglobus roseus]|uniref:CubicO group peptidase, beta-lactamase class C family n=1 Tax=Terriglobus roseus TaxID=392734 RepID=A0A1G7N4H1_9BACT|nr:serine hydrolase domain-containing protein [Terriglobus roseus]SDF68904.1 CubicO group peptidase, beta-lactamase class C family [Terriglobus roseus]